MVPGFSADVGGRRVCDPRALPFLSPASSDPASDSESDPEPDPELESESESLLLDSSSSSSCAEMTSWSS
jgi:hypothetical protein